MATLFSYIFLYFAYREVCAGGWRLRKMDFLAVLLLLRRMGGRRQRFDKAELSRTVFGKTAMRLFEAVSCEVGYLLFSEAVPPPKELRA